MPVAQGTTSWRYGMPEDAAFLAVWNHRLIREEGHRNTMTLLELENRMKGWLERNEYKAVVFSFDGTASAYGLFRIDPDSIYLRQFYVAGECRRRGIGRAAMQILQNEIWPKNVRLLVEVLCSNARAIAFWKAVGYRDYSLALEIMPENRKGAPS